MKVDIRKVPNVCQYCRKLMKKEGYPKTLELYRDDMLCLTVDVEEAARLKIVENVRLGLYHTEYTEKDRAKLLKWQETLRMQHPYSDLNTREATK